MTRNKKTRGDRGVGRGGEKKERKDRRKRSSESRKIHAAFRYFVARSKLTSNALLQSSIHTRSWEYVTIT